MNLQTRQSKGLFCSLDGQSINVQTAAPGLKWTQMMTVRWCLEQQGVEARRLRLELLSSVS